MHPVRVFTIVLHFQDVEDTLRCIGSVRRSSFRQQSLIVVDNGPSAEAHQALQRALPGSTVIRPGRNLGFAGGNNLGIRRALEHGADHVWILNPDTVVRPDTLERMVLSMESHPAVGIMGSRILNGADEGTTIWFNGGIIEWNTGGTTRHKDRGRVDADEPATEPFPCDYVTGASMLVRRQVFEDLGLLPEDYFLYFEETDFNVRAHRVGWGIMLEPRARLLHYQRSWERVPSPTFVYYYSRNRIVFGRRFSDRSLEVIVDDLQRSVDGWRKRMTEAQPAWLPHLERLVELGIEDAAAGRLGHRVEIDGMRWGDDG